jgi:NosR/NirI family nitrous oxide reductase transcriptional regulator
LILLGLLVIGIHLVPSSANAAASLETALKKNPAGDMVPGADRYGQPEGDPAFVRVWRGDKLAGYVFMNTDVSSAIGYSGKPIHMLIGLSTDGLITRALLYRHSEPIVLIGIPEKKITAYMDRYIGLSVLEIEAITRSDSTRTIDMISGATVTIMVIDDSITRSALKMARALGLAGLSPLAAGQQPVSRGEINLEQDTTEDWINLVGDGSVRRMRLSVGDVTAAFAGAGRAKAAAKTESDDPNAEFIDLYIALASVPTIGRTLLGDAEYALLRDRLAPGQQAIAVIGAGLYSFKGSGYVRGGIFDRIQLIQCPSSYKLGQTRS